MLFFVLRISDRGGTEVPSRNVSGRRRGTEGVFGQREVGAFDALVHTYFHFASPKHIFVPFLLLFRFEVSRAVLVATLRQICLDESRSCLVGVLSSSILRLV